MKNINSNVILLLFVLFSQSIFAQSSCLINGITFSTQSQVNSFPQDYPNCTTVLGNVTIKGNVTNTDSLYAITEISGHLDITTTIHLGSVEGLIGLQKIGGDFYLHSNTSSPAISNLNGLNNLTQIEGALHIRAVHSLTNLTGLDNLTNVGGAFSLIANDGMIDLSGLNSLNAIGDSLVISQQDLIENIDNFNTLSSIGGNINIKANVSMEDLSGFNNLSSLGGDIHITGPNDIVTFSAFNNLDTLNGHFRLVSNNDMTSFDALNSTKHINGDFYIKFNSIESINNLSLESINGSLDFSICPELQDLNGFSSLKTINGSLRLTNTYKLNSLQAFDSLTSINGELKLVNINMLPNLNGLENINPNSITNLEMTSCNILAYCNYPNICSYLDAGGDALISSNTTGCSSIFQIQGTCGQPDLDLDGDGFPASFDCDDANPDINPGAIEIFNNDVDEDCDGIAAQIDVDNDGFNSDEDCDDNNPGANPAQAEIPNNGIDEDCDGNDLILDPGTLNWCFDKTLADDNESDNINGALITQDSILFVASQFDDIVKYDLDNNYLGGWSVNGACISLAIDSEENIYVGLNGGDNLVEKYDKDGNLLQTFDVWGEANDIYVDDQFNVYVANQPKDKVYVFNSNGEEIDSWDYIFDNGPTLLTGDGMGFIYVGSENGIRKYTTNGFPVLGWGISNPQINANDFYGLEYNPFDNFLYVLHSFGANDKMFVYNTSAVLLYEFGVSLSWGTAVSFSSIEKMVLSDWSGDKVEIYTKDVYNLSYQLSDETCHNAQDGAIEVIVDGGCGVLNYELNTNDPLDQLSAGNYTLTITYPTGDTTMYEFAITAPDTIAIGYTTQDAGDGVDDGAITLMVSGGTPDYTYLWNDIDNSITPNLSNLSPGDYTVTITDANNCTTQETITVGGIGADLDLDNDGFPASVDCDDDNPDINPGAIEIPNNDIDEDCDGLANQIDEDNDGFNSDEDCNDDNPDINPDAIEIPNNGIDEDCDGNDLIVNTKTIADVRFHVFPNPVQHYLSLTQTGATILNCKISLHNIMGQLLLQKDFNKSQLEIDMTAFQSGVYILVIKDIKTGKQLIERIEFHQN